MQYLLFDFKREVPFPEPKNHKFKFIDLFAGIGGFRMALQNLKGKCVFTSEWVRLQDYPDEFNLGVPLSGRAFRSYSSLVPRCGVSASIPNAIAA